MARTSEEWSALLGSTLSKMALVRGTDSPDAYLPEECYPVIQKVFEVAMDQARGEGYAEAVREVPRGGAIAADADDKGMIRQVLNAMLRVPIFTWRIAGQ